MAVEVRHIGVKTLCHLILKMTTLPASVPAFIAHNLLYVL